jgi:hypothetical protein
MKKYEKVWKSIKKYEMKFMVEDYELNSCTNLGSGIDMNWCMKWFYEFFARNSELKRFHTFSCFFSFYKEYEKVRKSMKKYEKVWKNMKNKSLKTTPEEINHLLIFSVAFSSSMLLRSRDCCTRGSNSLTFGHSSRPWHPSSEVPHPHIHLEQFAAIPGAWLSVCTPMIDLCRPGKLTRISCLVAPIHEARN